jgi:1-acyl-sn-glycerol-3-phosphate acyltransferase
LRQALGSFVFTAYLFGSVAVYGTCVLLTVPFGHRATYAAARLWVDVTLAMLRRCCGLGYSIEGLENLPRHNTVILMKHSSAWETIAQLQFLPRQTWVIKRELLWAPVLGWVLVFLKPIAINRRAGRSAVQQVIDKGLKRLAEGFWIVVFPEGTRVAAGQTRKYGLSGALLASAAGRPVVPVAHNAGSYWPRRGLVKRAGTIRVVVGAPIPTAGREPREVNDEARRWIEARLAEMPQF